MNTSRIFLMSLLGLFLTAGCVKRNQEFTNQSQTVLTYHIEASVSGLVGTVILKDQHGDELSLSANGAASFGLAIPSGENYEIAVKTQPEGQLCSIAQPAGLVADADIHVAVDCQDILVEPLYAANGLKWNDYVKNDGFTAFSASDTACTASDKGGYGACLHGAEYRLVKLPGLSSCEGLSAKDSQDAFNWSCLKISGEARFVSSGLKDGKSLATLIDFASADWRTLRLSISKDGAEVLKTKLAKWWTNPMAASNAGGTLSTAGTIYLLNQDPTGLYAFGADHVALVVKPNTKLKAFGGNEAIKSAGFDFIWIEGSINADTSIVGVELRDSTFSVLRNLKVHNASNGILIINSSNNRIADVVSANNTNHGIRLENSKANSFSQLALFNNKQLGASIEVGSTDNTFIGGYASGNMGRGIEVLESNSNAFIGWTFSNNNADGLSVRGSAAGTFMDIASANNNGSGVTASPSLVNPNFNQFINIASAHNLTGISLGSALNSRFRGVLNVGSNSISNCTVFGASGLYSSTCSDTGAYGSHSYAGTASDAIFHPGITLSDSFVGKLFSTDLVNETNFLGFAVAMTAASDWTQFATFARAWGLDGSPFAAVSNQGACNGTCQVWDWSVLKDEKGDLGDDGAVGGGDDLPALLGQVSCPTEASFNDHRWSAATEADCDRIPGAQWHGGASYCSSPVLMGASEILGDGIGNDNGLCERGESCSYTPNVGGYQGHGEVVKASISAVGSASCPDLAVSKISFNKFSINGK